MPHATPRPQTESLLATLDRWIERVLTAAQRDWYRGARADLHGAGGDGPLTRSLALVPRRLGLADLPLAPSDLAEAEALRPGFDPHGLSVDQAARIGLLLAAPRTDEGFATLLTDLSRHADLRAHVTYLRGLPLYPAPERLIGLAEAGLRSAITPVFEAVAHRNPFPAETFDEAQWNRMILKAVFIGAPLAPVHGLDRRANPTLAAMLLDYAREREAAGRAVPDDLWRCVTPFGNRGGS